MKENNSGEHTVKKKRLIYTIIIAVCALLLIAATVLTVYFVTSGNEVLENPIDEPNDPTGGDEPSDPTGGDNQDDPVGGDQDDDPVNGNGGEDEPNDPTGGDDTVIFVSPVAEAVCTVEYQAIYTNQTRGGIIYRHMGVDFSAGEGTPVVSVAAGVVSSISYSETLGNVIIIDHGDGLLSYYRFIEPIDGLTEGNEVAKGEQIATVAAAYGTEYKDGTHLHLEISLNGKYVDPADYFDITYEEK